MSWKVQDRFGDGIEARNVSLTERDLQYSKVCHRR